MRRPVALACLSVAVAGACLGAAQAPAAAVSSTTFRVFLKNGQIVPSYGEAAVLADKLVFNLILQPGPPGRAPSATQLTSVPIDAVDTTRTSGYAESMHAAYYAATRGEGEYVAMTADVERQLKQLTAVADPRQRIILAQQARAALLDWSAAHFHYRDGDVQELARLFDDVILELRVAAGESAFSLDLGARPPVVREALLPEPTLREAIEAALSVSTVAGGADRVAVLRAASAAAANAGVGDLSDLGDRVRGRLVEEGRVDAAYTVLADQTRQRADAAVRAGDVRALERLRASLPARDAQLGGRRPERLQAIVDELDTKLEAARNRRAALDHFAATRVARFDYEQHVRPALSGLDGLSPILRSIRDMRRGSFEEILNAETRLYKLEGALSAVAPPADFSGVHATIVSALRMGREACVRGRQAAITGGLQEGREASAAAAGALLLYEQARRDLLAGLRPPKLE